MLKLAHIALSVSSIDKSEAFYRGNFGFRRSKGFKFASIGLKICILKKDAVALELFEFKNYSALPEYRKDLTSELKTLGVKHFAFQVANIKREYNRLKKAKVNFETDMRVFEDGKKYFFIKDPDGILIELMEAQ